MDIMRRFSRQVLDALLVRLASQGIVVAILDNPNQMVGHVRRAVQQR
jgi:hypothetical protein